MSDKTNTTAGPLMLYDGDCGFCHASVRFLLNHERADDPSPLTFAALKTPTARAALTAHGMPADYAKSIVLIERGVAYTASTSVLRSLGHLRQPWRAMRVLLVVPRPLRDVGYDVVSRYRGWLAGHVEHCSVPQPAQRERFLDFC